MEGINTSGQEIDPEASHPFPHQGQGMDPYVACTRSGEGACNGPSPLASFGNQAMSL